MISEQNIPGQSLSYSVRERIDLTCDEFESKWQSGSRPAIRDFLKAWKGRELRKLFEELLLLDVEYRRITNQIMSCKEYLKAYSSFASEIQAVDFSVGIDEPNPGLARQTQIAFAAGDHVSHFELIEKVGEGSEGEVWRAHDTKLMRDVALKLARYDRTDQREQQRFLREGRASGQLSHPNIVGVHEVGRSAQAAFIASDFVVGDDLRNWLSVHSVEPRDAAKMCIDLADALAHAHQQGVVHRDLKPANVLVNQDGKLLITDFGLAKWSEADADTASSGALIGTIAYMSPEQAQGDADGTDHRADIYSLGVILYEMLTGERPFKKVLNQSLEQQLRSVTDVVPRSPRDLDRDVPPELAAISLKCLKKDPLERYQSVHDVAKDLRRFLRGEPVTSLPVSSFTRFKKWIWRRPAIAGAIGLGFIAVASLLAAGQIAEKNRRLLGLQRVLISTEPAGATVTMVPHDPATGELVGEDAIRIRRKTPATAVVPPGDYLLVAVLDDGRFHEVHRRVPKSKEDHPGALGHLSWEMSNGKVIIPPVEIPNESVAQEMVAIPGSERTPARVDDRVELTTHYDGPGFFMDRQEFSNGSARKAGYRFAGSSRNDRVPYDAPANASFEEAVAYAESVGKRLPSKQEFLHAILTNSTTDLVDLEDRFAEWTASSPVSVAVGAGGLDPASRECRVVIGGDAEQLDLVSQFAHIKSDGGRFFSVPRFVKAEGLGFRCVRSVRPRFSESSSVDDWKGHSFTASVGD